jgi:hypothetical protein
VRKATNAASPRSLAARKARSIRDGRALLLLEAAPAPAPPFVAAAEDMVPKSLIVEKVGGAEGAVEKAEAGEREDAVMRKRKKKAGSRRDGMAAAGGGPKRANRTRTACLAVPAGNAPCL